MNYQRIYNELIINRQNNPLSKETYTEKHHIIPKSHGGSNNKDNLVVLNAREHFIAHWLLWRIHRDRATAYSFNMMCKDRHGSRYKNSLGFAEAKKAQSKAVSIYQSGENSGMYGKRHSEETKKKMSSSQIGSKNHRYGKPSINKGVKYSLERIENMSNIGRGRKATDETKRKISEATKGKNNPNFGKRHGEETKIRISELKIGIPSKKKDKTLYIFQHKDGQIRIDTQHNMGKEFSRNINAVINGKLKSSSGWKYLGVL